MNFLMILKTLGSLYLLFLGINSILSSKELTINESKNLDRFSGFLAGLITNITNIKAILFFITVFSVVIDSENSLNLMLYGAYMAFATFIWFLMISLSLLVQDSKINCLI